jgi:hypothetical protein
MKQMLQQLRKAGYLKTRPVLGPKKIKQHAFYLLGQSGGSMTQQQQVE